MLYGFFFVLLCLRVFSLHVLMRFDCDILCDAVCGVCRVNVVLLFKLCVRVVCGLLRCCTVCDLFCDVLWYVYLCCVMCDFVCCVLSLIEYA